MGNYERERISNSVLESSILSHGSDIGRTNAVANRMSEREALIKKLRLSESEAEFLDSADEDCGPWVAQLEKK